MQEIKEKEPVGTPPRKKESLNEFTKQQSRSEQKPQVEHEYTPYTETRKSIDKKEPVKHFELDNSLLNKWEKEYGGREKRQYVSKENMYKNSWDVDKQFQELQKIGQDNIQPEFESPVKKPSYTRGKTQKDFDYNWDEDEYKTAFTTADKKKGMRSKKLSGLDHQYRVPMGAMPYADSPQNEQRGRKMSDPHYNLANHGKNILGQ